MNKRKFLALSLTAVMTLSLFAGCSKGGDSSGSGADTKFSYSDGIDENGYFKDVKALDYVKLPDYKSFTIPKEKTVATKEAIQAKLDEVIAKFTTHEPDKASTKKIADGDTVNIDYVGSIDGIEFEGGTTNGKGTDVTIGETNFIDDFIQQLVGHKIGDKFNVEVTFPDDYGKEELNGKDATFNITINHFYKPIVPEINDEFVAKNLSGYYKTVEEMMKGFEAQIIDTQVKSHIQSLIFADTALEKYPESLIEYEKSATKYGMEASAAQYGMKVEDMLSMYGFDTIDAYIEGNMDNLKTSVAYALIAQGVCEENKLVADENDVKTYFKKNFGTEDYSEFTKIYGENYLRNVALSEKMMDFLVENATVEG
ncbi:MAG: FKBP-type peptidyl-prolyl cis-trans isomerase [Oscillospiraceae bacterium]